MITENFLKSVADGRKGLNKGLTTGLPRLDSVIYGIQRKWLTIVFADSGAGKSTFTDYIAIYQPYQQYLASGKTLDVHFLLFSFEMSAEETFAKLLSMYIYEKYGRVITFEQMFGLYSGLSDEDYAIIQEATDWLKGLEELCTIIDISKNANGVYGEMKEWTERYGTYEARPDGKGEIYKPNNPRQYLIAILDHVSLLKNNGKVKEEIDQVATYFIHFRNKCGITGFIVQQANRNLKSKERKETEEGLNLSDLRDSSDTSNAANTVIGIYNPFREHLTKFKGYIIDEKRGGLGDRGRFIQILKGRFGKSDLYLGTAFFGEVGIFKELPLPDQIIDYAPLKTL